MAPWQSLYYPLGLHYLDASELRQIEIYLKQLPLETITIGDAGERNSCSVGRLYEDLPGKYPQKLNTLLCDKVMDIFWTTRASNFFSQFFDDSSENLCIRRSQVNILREDSYVGRHLDIDSNPDYTLAAVLQLGDSFEGGDFLVYPNQTASSINAQRIRPEYGSLTISWCNTEHEVSKVLSGERTSFVSFISNYSGINRRIYNSTKIC